jgi:hypothetical protein
LVQGEPATKATGEGVTERPIVVVQVDANYGGSALIPISQLAASKPSDQSRIPLRQKTNFSRPFNPITPVQISREKYSALRSPQINRTLPRIPPHREGRFAIVTNVEAGSGGRDGSQACFTPTNEPIRLRGDRGGTGSKPVAPVLAEGFRGRPSRVVLAPRRWR